MLSGSQSRVLSHNECLLSFLTIIKAIIRSEFSYNVAREVLPSTVIYCICKCSIILETYSKRYRGKEIQRQRD